MLLINLRQYIKTHRLVSLFELTNYFNLEAEIIRDMLNVLIRKGNVRQKIKTNSCGVKCVKCHPLVSELYEWISAT